MARKPVFGISDKARLKPVCSATEVEILLGTNLDIVLSNQGITKALIRLRICAAGLCFFCLQTPEDRFSCVKAHLMINSECLCNLAVQNWFLLLKSLTLEHIHAN